MFCGRIHIFLTRIFPISEKSALNLNSNFNLENETKYDSEVPTESELDPKVKLENTLGTCCGHDRVINELEGFLFFRVLSKIKSIKRCFRTWEKLYTSIWGVQDFFRSPLGMYEPEKFKIFEESVNKIIETFKNYKLGLVI